MPNSLHIAVLTRTVGVRFVFHDDQRSLMNLDSIIFRSFCFRLRGELGMYLALVGHRLKGSDCYHAGIATHLCPADQVSNLKEDLVNSSSDEIANVLEAYHQKFNLKPFSLEADLPLINEACQASSVEEILSNFKANRSSH